jgi:hypothetical protein
MLLLCPCFSGQDIAPQYAGFLHGKLTALSLSLSLSEFFYGFMITYLVDIIGKDLVSSLSQDD